MATSKDVAKLAGVSHTTVSRAFRGDGNLKPQTYEKVMAAAAQLHYTPNSLASGLKQRRSKSIGWILSDIANPFFTNMIEPLQSCLYEKGYRLIIAFDGGDALRQQRAVESMLASQVEALLLTPVPMPETPSYVQNRIVPLMQLFTKPYAYVAAFTFDDNHGAYEGMCHLLEQGHRNIGILGGLDRAKGIEQACAEWGVTPRFWSMDDLSDNMGIKRQITERIEIEQPTAIFAVGNLFSRPAYEAIQELTLRIPEDISFLAFDDLQWTQMLHITVITHPIQDLTQCLADRLIQMLENGRPLEDAVFQPFLLKRDSVKTLCDCTK